MQMEHDLKKLDSLEERLLTEILTPSFNSISNINKILSQNIDPNIAERFGNNSIHHAAKLGQARVLELLVEAGGDPTKANHTGQTALIIASRGATRGHSLCVEYLLRSGCDVNAIDYEGRISLRQAILASNVRSVELLLQFGSDLSWDEHLKIDSGEAVAIQFAWLCASYQPKIFNKLPERMRKIFAPHEKIIGILKASIPEGSVQ